MKVIFLATSMFLALSFSFAGTQDEKSAQSATQTESSVNSSDSTKAGKKEKKAKKNKKSCCTKNGESKKACCAVKTDCPKKSKDCPANAKCENGKGNKTGQNTTETK